MILHTKINNDGTLNIVIPRNLWGKSVTISIDPDSFALKHDETVYLLSSQKNVQKLEQAKQEFNDKQWIEVKNLDDLF